MNMVSVIIILWFLLYGGAMVQAMNGLQIQRLIEDPYNSIAFVTASTLILISIYLLCKCYYKTSQ